jgi:hypothetical protein
MMTFPGPCTLVNLKSLVVQMTRPHHSFAFAWVA